MVRSHFQITQKPLKGDASPIILTSKTTDRGGCSLSVRFITEEAFKHLGNRRIDTKSQMNFRKIKYRVKPGGMHLCLNKK